MADGGALRELLISLGAEFDTSELEEGEKKAEGIFGKLKEGVKALAEVFAVEKFREFVGGQIEMGAQLKVTAERLGTTTDELQAMRLAAQEAGVSAETMDTSLRFLNRNIGRATEGGGAQAQAFAKLGIAIKDTSGVVRPAGDVLGDLADHIAEIEDPAKKTKIAIDLLGRGGSQLIPLLNRGGEAFRDARKDALELGGGLSNQFVEAAHKAEEANVKLNFAFTSLKSNIANAVLPTFTAIVQGFTNIVKIAVDVEKRSHIVEDAFLFLKNGAIAFGIYKIVTAMRALSLASLFNPLGLLVVGAVAALLAYNDLKVALEGGKSVFGDTFGHTGIETLRDDLDDANDVIDNSIDLFTTMGEILVKLWDIVKEVGASFGYLGNKVAEVAHKANADLVEKIGVVTGEDNSKEVAEERAHAKGNAKRAAEYADTAGAADDDLFSGFRSGGTGFRTIGGRKTARHSREAQQTSDQAASALPVGLQAGFVPAFNPGQGPYVDAYNSPSVPGTSGGKAAGTKSVVVHQTNTANVTQHLNGGDLPGVTRATKGALADANQIATNNAYETFGGQP
jgi:hypothetical protein